MVSRTRTRGSNPIYTGHRVTDRKSASSVNTSFNAEVYGQKEEMSDILIPGFRRRSQNGEIFNNAMSKSSFEAFFENTGYAHVLRDTTSIPTAYAWRDTFDDFIGFARGPIHTAFNFNSAVLVNRKDLAAVVEDVKIRALASIKKPDANTLVNLGEAKETIRLIQKPLSGIEALTRTLWYKTRFLPRLSRAFANLHLQWSFGVRPLISEVEGYMKALDRKFSDRRTGRASADISASSNGTSVLYNGSVLTTCQYSWSVSESFHIRGGFLYSDEYETMSDRMGLSIRELPSAAWELIPFSFVADWVGNVEDVISAYMALIDTKILAGWVTTERRITRSEQAIPGSFSVIPTWNVTRTCSDFRSGVLKTYSRTPVVASASFVRFGLRPNLGRVAVLSSISLLIQKLIKK